MLTIDVTGEPTGLSWYEVWEGAVALTSACVRGRQKCGKASGLGLYNCGRVQIMAVANAFRSRT